MGGGMMLKAAQEICLEAKGLTLHSVNEATTRLKIIDRIIFEVLGWAHSDVDVEEHVSEDGKSTYADYVLKSAMAGIVIEAKKVGVTFDDIDTTRREEKINTLTRTSAGPAIMQARDYARKLSIPFAAVTNGNQWIIFTATRTDQVTFEQSRAFIFPSLDVALRENIDEFLKLLSRGEVIAGSLEHALIGRMENQTDRQRLNDYYHESFSKIHRQNLFHLIDDEINTAFSEDIVFTSPDLLEKLYVDTPDRTKFDSRIHMHIVKRKSVVNGPSKSTIKANDNANVSKKILSASERTRPLAIIVLGSVGSGKTTFLQHTRYVKNDAYFAKHKDHPYPHWIYVDYREFSPSEDHISFLFNALFDYIQADEFLSDHDRCIKYAYQTEINAMKRGPLKLINDPDEVNKKISEFLLEEYSKRRDYVEKILSYAARNAPIFLVVDNVDQFPEEGLHKKIFSDVAAISFRIGLNLFISLREDTYVNNRNLPIFDAFDFDPIRVEPPIIEAVISRRFFVSRQLMDGKKCEFTAENGISVALENKAVINDLLQHSVLGTEVGRLIEVMATGDVRLALRITREFLQYGYSATGKALEIYHKTGKYTLPPHEALRAIMHGNSNVYSDEYSVVGNPLDAKINKTECQFLRIYIITALANLASSPRFRSCLGSEIQKNLRSIGFGDSIVLRVLNDLFKFRYLHTISHTEPSFDSEFIPTRLAGYIVRDLLANFAFLENLMTDTFIFDKSTWSDVYRLTQDIYSERSANKRLEIRKERALIFFDFLLASFQPLAEESQRRGLPSEWCTNPFEAISDRFKEDLKRATRSALRLHPEGSFKGLNHRRSVGTVTKCDASRKFAFVSLDKEAENGYVSSRVIERTDIDIIEENRRVICDVIDGARGPEVIKVEEYSDSDSSPTE